MQLRYCILWKYDTKMLSFMKLEISMLSCNCKKLQVNLWLSNAFEYARDYFQFESVFRYLVITTYIKSFQKIHYAPPPHKKPKITKFVFTKESQWLTCAWTTLIDFKNAFFITIEIIISTVIVFWTVTASGVILNGILDHNCGCNRASLTLNKTWVSLLQHALC